MVTLAFDICLEGTIKMAKNTEFNNKGNENPHWSVKLNWASSVLVVFDSRNLLKFSSNKGQIWIINCRCKWIVNCLTTLSLYRHSLLCKLSIIRLFWIKYFAKTIIVINYAIRLIVRMKWPQSIVNFADYFICACVEILLIFIAIKNVLLKETNSSLVWVRLFSQISSFQCCFCVMGWRWRIWWYTVCSLGYGLLSRFCTCWLEDLGKCLILLYFFSI